MEDIKEKILSEVELKQLQEKLGEQDVKAMNREDKRQEIKNANRSERYICPSCKKKTIGYKYGCIWCEEVSV